MHLFKYIYLLVQKHFLRERGFCSVWLSWGPNQIPPPQLMDFVKKPAARVCFLVGVFFFF